MIEHCPACGALAAGWRHCAGPHCSWLACPQCKVIFDMRTGRFTVPARAGG